ncbi:hypothetical protein C5167_018440 [Papaver somniferum]|uniref:Ubiquitin-like protease family profile domain-containing protein n=1 Tax=Papaver somniferum TaxID=3469 RepID=A0A4Y7IR98_PAPSO|nr:hypothetical protein C5167_018440 [Papaver somniferum]
MGVGAKKKKKYSRKVKFVVGVDETVLNATVEDKRVVSTDGVERIFIHPARYRAYTCKVTTYSSPKVLKWVRNLLSPTEQEKFMSTAIGSLLHLPVQTWSSALFHFLLACQISTGDEGDKGNREEMRVMVCVKEPSFGKKEFALISGLSFRKSNHNFSRPDTKPCLKMKYFPNEGKPVTAKLPLESDDMVKLSLLYVVHRYVLGKTDDKVVEYDHWYLVDNLVDFNSYPWAEIAFSRTIVNSNAALDYQIKANRPVGTDVTYKCQGMAHVLVVRISLGSGVLLKVRRKFGSNTTFANWLPRMHSVTCDLVINHDPLLEILKESKDEVCDDIMWHKEDANRLVMLGLCEGPLVDDEEDSLKNENVVEKEDLFEKGEEENMSESENIFVDEQVPDESSMDDEDDEEDLLGNENVVKEEDLFEKDEEEARVAHPSYQPDVLCPGTSTSVIASFESFVKNAMIGYKEDLKSTVIGELEVFRSAVKGQLEELSVQVSNSHKTMLNNLECLTAEIKSIKDKIGGTQTYNALSKTKTGNSPEGHNEEEDFDGAAMKKPDVFPGNASNSIELSSGYPYNPPNKEVDVSQAVVSRKHVRSYMFMVCLHIIDSALVLLHKSFPSDKSTGTWSYFLTHLPQLCAAGDFAKVDRLRTGLAGRRGCPPSEHLPSWDKVYFVYSVVCIKESHWVAVSIQVKEKTIIIYDSLRPNRNNRSSKTHPEVGQIRDYLEKAYNRGPWWCSFDLKTPMQNDTNSCGVLAFKFIEHMVRKKPVCKVKPAFATR